MDPDLNSFGQGGPSTRLTFAHIRWAPLELTGAPHTAAQLAIVLLASGTGVSWQFNGEASDHLRPRISPLRFRWISGVFNHHNLEPCTRCTRQFSFRRRGEQWTLQGNRVPAQSRAVRMAPTPNSEAGVSIKISWDISPMSHGSL